MRISSNLVMAAFFAGAVIAAACVASAGERPASGKVPSPDLQAAGQADQSSATRKKRPSAAATQIACTRFGCNAIPPGCHIEKEFSPDGTPTGFDLVVCPSR